jgi:hypothetical protein
MENLLEHLREEAEENEDTFFTEFKPNVVWATSGDSNVTWRLGNRWKEHGRVEWEDDHENEFHRVTLHIGG